MLGNNTLKHHLINGDCSSVDFGVKRDCIYGWKYWNGSTYVDEISINVACKGTIYYVRLFKCNSSKYL